MDDQDKNHSEKQGEVMSKTTRRSCLCFFPLGAHKALVQVQSQLLKGGYLFALLDHVYDMPGPGRVSAVYKALPDALFEVVGIRLSESNTRT